MVSLTRTAKDVVEHSIFSYLTGEDLANLRSTNKEYFQIIADNKTYVTTMANAKKRHQGIRGVERVINTLNQEKSRLRNTDGGLTYESFPRGKLNIYRAVQGGSFLLLKGFFHKIRGNEKEWEDQLFRDLDAIQKVEQRIAHWTQIWDKLINQ